MRSPRQGGPGGSGVNFLYRAGPQLSEVFDGAYDIVGPLPDSIQFPTNAGSLQVSWDPRLVLHVVRPFNVPDVFIKRDQYFNVKVYLRGYYSICLSSISRPRVECFANKRAQDLYYLEHDIAVEFANLTDPAELDRLRSQFQTSNAEYKLLAQLCDDHSGETLRYVGTTTVVRDLEYLSSVVEGKDTPV